MLRSPYRTQIYPTNQYFFPNTTTRVLPQPTLDVNWFDTWPIIRSIFLGSIMVLSSAAIIGLEIANVAIEGNKDVSIKQMGLGTAKVGAGIWCGSISFIAAVFIIVTIFVKNKRIAATLALIAVTLAFFFSLVLVGLTANAIEVNPLYGDSVLESQQFKLVIAILSLALFNIILCIAFFIIYISVFFSSSTRRIK